MHTKDRHSIFFLLILCLGLYFVGCNGSKKSVKVMHFPLPIDYEVNRLFHKDFDESEEYDEKFSNYFPFHLLENNPEKLNEFWGDHLSAEDLHWIQEANKNRASYQNEQSKNFLFKFPSSGTFLDYFPKAEMNHSVNGLLVFNPEHHSPATSDQKISDTLNQAYAYEIRPYQLLNESSTQMTQLFFGCQGELYIDRQPIEKADCIFSFNADNWLDKAVFFYQDSFYFIKSNCDQGKMTHFDYFSSHLEQAEGPDEILYKVQRYELKY